MLVVIQSLLILCGATFALPGSDAVLKCRLRDNQITEHSSGVISSLDCSSLTITPTPVLSISVSNPKSTSSCISDSIAVTTRTVTDATSSVYLCTPSGTSKLPQPSHSQQSKQLTVTQSIVISPPITMSQGTVRLSSSSSSLSSGHPTQTPQSHTAPHQPTSSAYRNVPPSSISSVLSSSARTNSVQSTSSVTYSGPLLTSTSRMTNETPTRSVTKGGPQSSSTFSDASTVTSSSSIASETPKLPLKSTKTKSLTASSVMTKTANTQSATHSPSTHTPMKFTTSLAIVTPSPGSPRPSPPAQSPRSPPSPRPPSPRRTINGRDRLRGKGGGCPLVFDMNKDGQVTAKTGVGISTDQSDVYRRDGGAVGGDKMLAMSDLNANGAIDIEDVFGNFTISPFTLLPYNAKNGFEALHLLALDVDRDERCRGLQAVTNQGEEILVHLMAVKICLIMYGRDLGFISDNNIKALEPLGDAITVDVGQYIETPDDISDGIIYGQKGHYYDIAGLKQAVIDVWFNMF
ncbi:hypothetical protein MIR68_004561 [Amoeboaphelidium protococcarum]|nr:hypothetical protein MIR68_004561 [Amoeboaphelidium protococcarum]